MSRVRKSEGQLLFHIADRSQTEMEMSRESEYGNYTGKRMPTLWRPAVRKTKVELDVVAFSQCLTLLIFSLKSDLLRLVNVLIIHV